MSNSLNISHWQKAHMLLTNEGKVAIQYGIPGSFKKQENLLGGVKWPEMGCWANVTGRITY